MTNRVFALVLRTLQLCYNRCPSYFAGELLLGGAEGDAALVRRFVAAVGAVGLAVALPDGCDALRLVTPWHFKNLFYLNRPCCLAPDF